MRKPTTRILALAVLALAGAACSSSSSPKSDSGASTGASAGGGSDVSVEIKGIAFSPSDVRVAAGGSVTWTDREAVEHTITSGKPNSPDGLFDKVVKDGDTFSFTFQKPGTFPYYCQRHPDNMQGTITVA